MFTNKNTWAPAENFVEEGKPKRRRKRFPSWKKGPHKEKKKHDKKAPNMEKGHPIKKISKYRE